ncbi:hypothetical protein ACFLTP_03425, partial [Chloroflexota bacterium]
THRSREEFYRLLTEGYWEKLLGKGTHIITVGLWGWASGKQVEYEEMVLKEIVDETGGKWASEEAYQLFSSGVGADCIRVVNSVRLSRIGTGGGAGGAEIEGLGDMLRAVKSYWEVHDKYMPPLLDTGHPCWIAPYDFGHAACLEVYGAGGQRGEEAEKIFYPVQREVMTRQFKERSVELMMAMLPQNIVGPAFNNIHQITAQIKKALDPNYVANPTRFIDMEGMDKAGEINIFLDGVLAD